MSRDHFAGIEREFEYKPKWTVILGCFAFFGAGAAVMASVAAKNDRGMIINDIIELGVENATRFLWGVAACCLVFVCIAGVLAWHRLVRRQRIAFTPTTLLVPASGWTDFEKEILYTDIYALSQSEVNGRRSLTLELGADQYCIAADMLPSAADFDEVVARLVLKVEVARASKPNWG